MAFSVSDYIQPEYQLSVTIVVSVLGFVLLIGLSKAFGLAESGTAAGASTPKKDKAAGTVMTQEGRRSTRKRKQPQRLDPSEEHGNKYD